jgi:hypothetical protein
MDDLEIDRTLRAALSEDPSPDFVARVRTSIIEAPRPSLFAGSWMPVAGVVCVVVMITVWLPRENVPDQASATYLPSAMYSPRAPYLPPAVTPVSRLSSVVVPSFSSAKPDPQLPEVIIAADDVEAVRQFVSGARDRRFVATFEETYTPTAWAMSDLAITPITVEPLDSTQSHNN